MLLGEGVDNSISSITDTDLSSSVLEFSAPEGEAYQQQHEPLNKDQRMMQAPVTLQPTTEVIHQKPLTEGEYHFKAINIKVHFIAPSK